MFWNYGRRHIALEGPAMHLCLVLLVCRSYETKPDFAGPPYQRAVILSKPRFLLIGSTYSSYKAEVSYPVLPHLSGMMHVLLTFVNLVLQSILGACCTWIFFRRVEASGRSGIVRLEKRA
jgi:hypothetical protein